MSSDDLTRLVRRALPAGAIVAVGVGFAVSMQAGRAGSALVSWAGAFTAAVAVASLCYAARRLPDTEIGCGSRDSLRWFWIAALCWCAGALINATSAIVLNDAAVLSLSDLFFLAAVAMMATGLVVTVRPPRSARHWLRLAADSYVCVASVFIVGWIALFGRLYHDSGESPPEFMLELLYPIVNVVVVCVTLPFALGAARGIRSSTALAYGALLMIATADIAGTVIRLRGGPTPALPAEGTRAAGLLVLSVAPWIEVASRPRPAEGAVIAIASPTRAGGRGRAGKEPDTCSRMGGLGIAAVATVAAATAALLLICRSLTAEQGLDPVVELLAGSAVVVVLVRLAELLRENHRLRRTVDTGEEYYRVLAESINDVALICGLDGRVQYAGEGVRRTFSHRPEELLGRRLHDMVHPEDLPGVEAMFARFTEREEGTAAAWPQDAQRFSCRVRAADGTWLPTESTISRYACSSEQRGRRLLVTVRDLSEQAALWRQVTHLTFHDGLTGLPNRAYFEERASEVLSRQQGAGRVAVVFADLDGFTAVNDSAGHAAGDQVLAQAARRLRATVQAEDTVARWGGDDFAVLVENVAEGQPVVELAERLLRVLSDEPYRVGTRGIVLTASVGVAFAAEEKAGRDSGPETGRDSSPGAGRNSGPGAGRNSGPETGRDSGPEAGSDRPRNTGAAELIRNGDLAMARAKELGGGRVEVFAAHMHADVVRRLELGSDLQRALAEEQFTIEFQPVVELTTSRVTGVEALVRWWRGGVSVLPEEFIGPAEESGMMVPLGNWILREACSEVARWRASSWDIGVSVNFAARQVAAPRFVETVAEVLEETGLPPRALTIEVKEEVLVEDAGHNVERLSALRDLGVRLAIDDFGTGYASLAYLGQLPVDIIKIDPSFVAGLGRDETLTLLTRTIVRLGHDLGLIVVAEGIERPEQLELLREMGCPRGQGFLVARPMPPGRARVLVRTNFTPTAMAEPKPRCRKWQAVRVSEYETERPWI